LLAHLLILLFIDYRIIDL